MSINQESLTVLPCLIAFILSFAFRGFFRSLAAYLLGDNTAKDYGFLTLNPAAHVDAVSTVIAILLITAMILLGWGGDAVAMAMFVTLFMISPQWYIQAPINGYNFREKIRERSLAIVGIAGIMSNFILALLGMYLCRLVLMLPFVSGKVKLGTIFVTSILSMWSVSLGLIYAIPLPMPRPLPQSDGFLVFAYLFPSAAEYLENNLTPQSLLVAAFIIACLWAIPIISLPFLLLRYFILKLLSFLVFI